PKPALLAALCFVIWSAATVAHALEVKKLPSPRGEEVWYVADHTLPMIALFAAFPAGSAYDPVAKPGLANFAADLLDEGAGTLDADAFQTALGNRAIRLSVTPDRDYLIVSLVTLADNAKDAFQLLGLALGHPRFDADAVARVRAQILAGLSQQDGEPATVADKGVFRAFFRAHPYAHPIGGDGASVSRITATDLKRFAATHWVAHGLKIAVSGDVDEKTLTALLKTAFGGLSTAAPPLLPAMGRPGQAGVSVIAMPVPQPNVAFALPAMLRSDPDYIPAYIANQILGGDGSSSRLNDEVRQKRGLTYDISSSLESLRRSGMVLGEVATKRSSVRQTIAVIRDTLAEFAENGPTDKELADAKTYLTGSFPLVFGSNVGTADQLNTFQRLGLPVDYVQNRNALIKAATLEQVKDAAQRLFNPARLIFVVAGSPGEATAGGNRAPAAADPQGKSRRR
ncbi:MAG TPA: pitrilysin family protein, partial [Candidatus Binataceae bacterium]